jgi:hypothetical protein
MYTSQKVLRTERYVSSWMRNDILYTVKSAVFWDASYA